MTQYISKSALVAEIESKFQKYWKKGEESDALQDGNAKYWGGVLSCLNEVKTLINTLEVIDPYEQYIQYASIESGIKAHAEDYSFNIESELFNQLTKEQQALWRKEIEQAVISGGYNGLDLAKDPRYKENVEVKEVDLEKKSYVKNRQKSFV